MVNKYKVVIKYEDGFAGSRSVEYYIYAHDADEAREGVFITYISPGDEEFITYVGVFEAN